MSYGRGRKRGDIVRASEILLSSALGVANGIATLGTDGKVPAGQLPSLDYVPNSQKGIANGVATLGSDGKVPSGQLPSLDYVPNSQKGIANGVATLGSDGKVPSGQLPSLNYVPLGGGTMTGDLYVVKNNAWLTLQSSNSGANGVEQAAGISIGESGYKGGATLHLTYTGDGYGHIGMGAVDASTSLPTYEAMRLYYTNNVVQFLATPNVNGNTIWHSANDGAGSGLDADLLDGLDSGAFMRAVSANGYYGLVAPGGDAANWIRTTTNGIIPSAAGGASSLGTSSWPFLNVYSNTFYEGGVALSSKYLPLAGGNITGKANFNNAGGRVVLPVGVDLWAT